MNYVNTPSEIEYTIKKSRFIAYITPCQTEHEVQHQLNQYHQQHPSAPHIVFAYRIKSEKGIHTSFMMQENSVALQENQFFSIWKEKTMLLRCKTVKIKGLITAHKITNPSWLVYLLRIAWDYAK